ncbi:MAG: tetratricopeptide repeat protein [Leptolyngbyaceae cyanobacterium bins.349]|nr:tetratricopeptide repeat protein [Leptolyngbyaceae cyanobacterium bins.349]
MKCPVCRATYRGGEGGRQEVCHRCGVDLAPLIHLHDQAVWHHRRATQAFQSGDYGTAIAHNRQAIALHAQQPDFHALAGQLAALQGNFPQAIAAWKTAQQLDPKHPTATVLLKLLDVSQ